ncbi:hypothetical protein PIB30_081875, partial [Stylosanthes scabra]|nr:hypothetical protein [Stylosanthes scabra]
MLQDFQLMKLLPILSLLVLKAIKEFYLIQPKTSDILLQLSPSIALGFRESMRDLGSICRFKMLLIFFSLLKLS